jgi:hypothetical protein
MPAALTIGTNAANPQSIALRLIVSKGNPHSHSLAIPLDVILIINNEVVQLQITVLYGEYCAVSFLAEYMIEKALLIDTILTRNTKKLTLFNTSTPIFQKSLEIGLRSCRA